MITTMSEVPCLIPGVLKIDPNPTTLSAMGKAACEDTTLELVREMQHRSKNPYTKYWHYTVLFFHVSFGLI